MGRRRRTELFSQDYPVTYDPVTVLQAVSNALLVVDAEVAASARQYGPANGWHREMVRTREVLQRHRQDLDHAAGQC